MHLIQLLLPLCDNDGNPFPEKLMSAVRSELTDRFGGVTAFTRTPAEGIWASGGEKVGDEIVLIEVMASALERDWWARYRARLEDTLKQERIIIRALEIDLI